jgi:predicted PurR-regulated permease PerM
MENATKNQFETKRIIEVIIKVAALGAMIIWSIQIIRPFLVPIIWGGILAVAVEPFIARFAKALGNRRTMASVLFVLAILAAVVLPTVMLALSSVDVVRDLGEQVQNKTLYIPPPPADVAEWPLVGKKVHQVWLLFATNLEAALKQFAPQVKTIAEAVLGSVGGGLAGVFMVVISICIAGVFLAKADASASVLRKVITRFAGERGVEIADLSTSTIRGVMQGVVGVAVIQAILSAIGMVLVGVPASGLWATLVLVVAVCQLPPILVLGPIALYVFSVAETTPAVIFLIWALLVSASDGVLKPLLMGRGVDIPMLVILIGALGGMMISGIIGLFVGAVVLAIMYTLFMAWLEENDEETDA